MIVFNKPKIALVFIMIGISIFAPAYGQNLNEASFFSRCYTSFTGEKVASDHPLLIDSIVKNNHDNTIKNCMKIFDLGKLTPSKYNAFSSGYPTVSALTNENSTESLKVLNYMYSVYSTFFEIKDFGQRPQTYTGMTTVNWDATEDVLYFMRSMFEGSTVNADGSYNNGVPYSDVLSSRSSLTGKRLFSKKNNHAVGICNSYGSNCTINPTYIHRSLQVNDWYNFPDWNWKDGRGSTGGSGPLVGIKVWPINHSTYYSANGSTINLPIYSPRSHGGGAIGSASYLLKNGQYRNGTDGGVFNRRRMVKNAFSSFLCRDQPPLPMDHPTVLQRVSEYEGMNFNKNHTLPFRESVVCASCHVTYDEAAAVYRNTFISSSKNSYDWNADGYTKGNYTGVEGFEKFGYDRHTEVGSSKLTNQAVPKIHLLNGAKSRVTSAEKESNIYLSSVFTKSKPKGNLIFTDYRGNDVSITLGATNGDVPPEDAGIHELGLAMASTDQYYVCAVNRMFNHLTGIGVHLENPNDSRMAERSEAEDHYLDKIIEPLAIGANGLSKHQSFRKMVLMLISTDTYRKANMRDVK